jgi:hypothetical protein
MWLKNKIKKLEKTLNINSKFCSCPGVSYFNLDWKSGDLVITKTCDKCGKTVEPISWIKLAKQADKEIETESRINPHWKTTQTKHKAV